MHLWARPHKILPTKPTAALRTTSRREEFLHDDQSTHGEPTTFDQTCIAKLNLGTVIGIIALDRLWVKGEVVTYLRAAMESEGVTPQARTTHNL